MTVRYSGTGIKRLEDFNLLTGRGCFTDDVHLPGMLHASFVRSSHAHARILGIDTSVAREMPGVHAVLTASDLPESLRMKRVPLDVPHPAIRYPLTPYMLAVDEVCYVGETVVVIIADTPHQADDAASTVMIDYDPLPAVADCEAALTPDSPTVHSSAKDNLAARFDMHHGDIERAFANAVHIVSETYYQHRGTACSIETRAVVASYNAMESTFRVWSATQAPHGIKRSIASMLSIPERSIRVTAEDVGGGFGPKLPAYPEEIVVPYCARLLGRPVKWVEDRRENFISTTQERDQVWHVKIAVDADGKILGLRGQLIHDTGAYLPWGIIVPYISSTTFPGPYVVPAFDFETIVAMTNKVGVTPLRGAGRQQAIFAMERLLDAVAHDLQLDRAEVRRRNLVPPEAMPYNAGLTFRDGKTLTYDSGDYPECQAMALRKADWDSFEERKRKARAGGRYIGVGVANYVEGTGLGPYECAVTSVLDSGRVLLRTGAAPQGQGHRTTLAQICADELNIDMNLVDVEVGDSASVPMGVGTFASRTMVNVGSSVRLSARAVVKKIKHLAALHLKAEESSIVLENGKAYVCGAPDRSASFAELALVAGGRPGFSLPAGVEPNLEATSYFSPTQATYTNGTHVAEVEVDPETGYVQVQRYIVAHDCGCIINPLLVEGQIQGGVAHGIGNALMEKMHYDSSANALTTTMGDYLLPDAGNVPEVEMVHMVSPSPLNPLGVKGAGEAGTLPAPAAIISAVEDALSEFGVRICELPILPERLCELIDESSQKRQGAAEKTGKV